jgi:hypothetical protein
MDPKVGDRVPPDSSGPGSVSAGRLVYASAVVCFAGVLVLVDRSDSDAANQVALLLLILFAAGLGALRPRQAWLSALIIGCTVAAARAFELLMGQIPTDPQAPLTLSTVATLLVLLVPAAVAAYAGAAARRSFKQQSSPPGPPVPPST